MRIEALAERDLLRRQIEDLKMVLVFACTACEPDIVQRFGARCVLNTIQDEADKALKKIMRHQVGNDNA